MRRPSIIFSGILAMGLICSGNALAHTPLCSCYENGDGTVTCEGGFSDGSSAAGVLMRVLDDKGGVLLIGKMDQDSEYTFNKPAGAYEVVFDAGEGHIITIESKDIAR